MIGRRLKGYDGVVVLSETCYSIVWKPFLNI